MSARPIFLGAPKSACSPPMLATAPYDEQYDFFVGNTKDILITSVDVYAEAGDARTITFLTENQDGVMHTITSATIPQYNIHLDATDKFPLHRDPVSGVTGWKLKAGRTLRAYGGISGLTNCTWALITWFEL